MTDLYETLGVARTASGDEIKRAYRRKAKAAHPDAGGSPEKFGALTNAYRILSDPASRERYDATGNATDPADTKRAEALMLIDQLVTACLTEPGWQYRDTVGTMKKKLRQNVTMIEQEIAHISEQAVEIGRAKKRFRAKSGDDVIGQMMDFRLRQMREETGKRERAVEVRKLSLQILDAYEFQADARPGSTATTNTMAFTVQTS